MTSELSKASESSFDQHIKSDAPTNNTGMVQLTTTDQLSMGNSNSTTAYQDSHAPNNRGEDPIFSLSMDSQDGIPMDHDDPMEEIQLDTLENESDKTISVLSDSWNATPHVSGNGLNSNRKSMDDEESW